LNLNIEINKLEFKPTGSVTFLFTDIEGSTKLSQEFPDSLQASLDIHHRILHEAIESNNGFVFEIIGDAFCAAFENAGDAVKAAVDAQLYLANEKWFDAVIKARMGIHSGIAEWNGKRYLGYITLARTARVMSAAYGEQIIVSNDTFESLFNNCHKDSKTLIFLDPRDFEVEERKEISFRDLGERRLKDVIKPIKLFQVTAPGLREDFPPLKTLDARLNNLPVQLTNFIGRENELKQIKDSLSNTHLLTITGSGGSGKSRLSLQTAADLIDIFANGVWFVELANLNDPVLLPVSIMSVIGILENPKESPEVTLKGYLKDKEILIILDNCEHLINACAVLVESLLSLSPKLKVLATSREPLKCSGEHLFRIPSLSTPVQGSKETPEQLTQYESVRLFIERSLTLDQGFKVTNENASALAEICFRLDGIPLAIELAAARTKILSLEKIFERLDDRFSLLTGGKRTALPRQQTLRSLIDWSYDLLSDNEKIIWNRLSVFRGGWELEAAEEICSDDIIDKNEIIELLQNLSEKSIIIFDKELVRYRMLETIRQYGDEKLRTSEVYKEIFKKHLKYYTEHAETADLKLHGLEIVTWLKVLDVEKGNIEKVFMFSDESGDIITEARLAGALGYYWDIRGQISEGILRLENIYLNIPETKNLGFIKIIFLIGLLTHRKGEFVKASEYLKESHDHYIKLNYKPGIGYALNSLGDICRDKGEYDKAADMYKESLEIRRNIGDKSGIADSLNCLGNVSFDKGEYNEADELYKKSLEIRRNIGDKRGTANSLHWLGNVSNYKREYDKATGYYGESLSIRREIGDKRGIASSLNNLGNVYIIKKEYENATDLYEESLVTFREIGDKKGIADSLNGLGNVSFDNIEYQKAADLYQESLAIKLLMGEKKGIAYSLNNLGNVFYHKGEYDKAAGYYEESLGIKREIGDKRGITNSLNGLGNVFFYKGEYDKATSYYEESLEISREIDYEMAIEDSLKNLGMVSIKRGEFNNAQKYYQEILSHSIDSGNKKKITENLLRLIDLNLKKKSGVSFNKLLGFLNHYSNSNKIIFEKSDQKVFDDAVTYLKENMSEEEFLKSFEEGEMMTLDSILNIKL